ncbi:MAG: FIST N-terminal domain-containing protein [bacterium]
MNTPPIFRSNSYASTCEEMLEELLVSDVLNANLNVCFVTSGDDLGRLGAELSARCDGTVIGCTTSGHIAHDGYQQEGIALLSFGEGTRAWSWKIDDVHQPELSIDAIRDGVAEVLGTLDMNQTFGLLLTDGLCNAEEWLTTLLFEALPSIPIVGGSAGDHLEFAQTLVLHDGVFESGIATFTLVTTDQSFEVFSMQHHHPTSKRLFVSKSAPEERRVLELNGLPAAQAYADAVGVSVDDLTPAVLAKHPLMVPVGQHYYIRSPRNVLADGSMMFFCALEQGIVLRIGESRDMIGALDAEMDAYEDADAILVFDCILRRLELEQDGLADQAGGILARHNAIGFSTYGEQFDALHVNQTMVGIAFGGRHGRE